MVGNRVAAIDWERCVQFAPQGIDLTTFWIAEKPRQRFSRDLDVDSILANLREHLRAADLPEHRGEVLTLLALLEMVIRFKSAQKVGFNLPESKFELALRSALGKWAT